MADVLQVLTAFGAGLLSFFSPCVLPLIPAYICFITGLSAEELSAPKEKDFQKVKTILSEKKYVTKFNIINMVTIAIIIAQVKIPGDITP